MSTIRCICGEVHPFDEKDTKQTLVCRCGRVLELKPLAEHGLVAWAEGRDRKRAHESRRSWSLLAGIVALVLIGGAWLGREPLRRVATTVLAPIGLAPSKASAPTGTEASLASGTARTTNRGGAGHGMNVEGFDPGPAVPSTGTWILRPGDVGGTGSLRIDNVAGRDAVAKLVVSERSWCAVYVRSGTGFTISGIPAGSYRLLFALGDRWDAHSGGFQSDPNYLELEGPLMFGITEHAGYRFKDSQHVTLRGSGESGTHEISVDAFSGS